MTATIPITSVRLFDACQGNPVHHIPTLLNDEQLDELDINGFLLLRDAVPADDLARWRAAIDRQCAEVPVGGDGIFLRDLPLKEPALQDVMRFPLGVSAARLMLGPNVRVRGLTARVVRPGDTDRGFGWHIHHRLLSDPTPRWFSPPQAIDCLIYLDGTRDGAGRTGVVPGSHRHGDLDLPWNGQQSQPGEVVVEADAGDCLIMHSNLWHRALPATIPGRLRRLLILGYTPSWYRGCPNAAEPEGLARLANGDPEWDRLCGIGGYT